MLQMFYLDVAYICNDFQLFLGVFASVFICMLQVFHLFLTYVVCVSSRCCNSRSGCCTCCEQAREAGAGVGGPAAANGSHVRAGSKAGEGGPHGAARVSRWAGRQAGGRLGANSSH
jgi:hypothetical protein